MGLHNSQDLYWTTIDGNVKTTGGTKNLAIGQVAIVNLDAAPTTDGATIANLDTITRRTKLELRIGQPNIGVTRSLDNKSDTSLPFTLDNIYDLRVDAPKKSGIGKDDFIIGYNGTDGSEIILENGDNEAFQLSLSGKAMSYLGYKDSCATVQIQLEAPNSGAFTMQEIIENAVETLKNYDLIGQAKLSDYVDIIPVNDTNPATVPGATPINIYSLTLDCVDGTYSDLGRVQAQYPDADVKQVETTESFTKYAICDTTAPADYVTGIGAILKGCDVCPPTYTATTTGFVYNVELEDNGADETATVQGIPTAQAGTAIKNGQEDGTGSYSVITDDELTQAQIETFVTANPTAEIILVSKNISELCKSTATVTTSWVQEEVCNTVVENWTIRLADTECGDSRLEELEKAFPGLTITEVAGSTSGCQRSYTAPIVSNKVCDECDPIYRDLFDTEGPEPFDLVEWVKEPKTYDPAAKMGIRFRAKNTILSGSENFRDDMPFIAESPRLSLAGGFPSMINESYNFGTNGRFTVKLLDRFEPAQNFGGDLRIYEDMGRVYFNGNQRHEGYNYTKFVLGEETRLKGTGQYVDYALTIEPTRTQGGFTQRVFEKRTYHIYAEVGKHEALEDLLNKLVAQAGVPTVQAYGE